MERKKIWVTSIVDYFGKESCHNNPTSRSGLFASILFFSLTFGRGVDGLLAPARTTVPVTMNLSGWRLFWILILLAVSYVQSGGQTPGEWTWMHGDNVPYSPGVFGIQGIPNSANKPTALYEPCEWKDNNGNFWLFGGSMSNNDYAALWKYNPTVNQWTWMKGPSAHSQSGVYGIQGISSPANCPGGRAWGAVTWTDVSGNLWLFGGVGWDAVGGHGSLNDLWKYDPNPASPTYNQWTWMKGPNTINDPGSYGTQTVSNPANLPPSRSEISCSWTDNTGNLWLYGGGNASGPLGDLWKYNITSNEWVWMHGANTAGAPAVYGVLGAAAPANTPGGRQAYCSWTDLSGNLWLFGGGSFPSPWNNDLWKYDIATNQWTWMNGSNTINNAGNYGARCVPAATNIPPSRYENRARVRDASGNFWQFGGIGGVGFIPLLNDLWHYNVSTSQWTWVSGDNIANQAGVYGVQGISAPANKPEAKAGSVGWIDNNGYIWVFGGQGINGYYNDLFRYVPDPCCMLAAPVVTASSNTTLCNGQSATLTVAGATSYSWSPGGQTATSIVVSPGVSTTYTVIGSSTCGSDTSSVTVTVSSAPSITASSSSTVCNGESTTLIASGATNYLWSPGAQSTSSIVVNLTTSTTYTVTSSNACGSTSSSVTVTVNTAPTATAWNNVTIAAGSSTTLSSNSNSSSVTYNWSPATGLSCANCQNPVATPVITTIYCVTVTDANGCTDDSCVTVMVKQIDCSKTELYLPNAFSPNNDGENDEFCLQEAGAEYCIKELIITIYDRWGELVYESTDKKFCWDGTYLESSMNTAVFVYYLRATLKTGEQIIKRGNVSLIK